MWLSDDKRQPPAQRIVYTGIIVDTIKGRFFCPDEKRVAFISAVRELGESARMTARAVAAVRGKAHHYSS